jgi:ribosomal protein S7
MEQFATEIVTTNFDLVNTSPKLYQLEILKNAFLNDQLKLQSKIKKFNGSELQLSVIVIQKAENAAICKAIFKFQTKEKFSNAC